MLRIPNVYHHVPRAWTAETDRGASFTVEGAFRVHTSHVLRGSHYWSLRKVNPRVSKTVIEVHRDGDMGGKRGRQTMCSD